MAILQTNPFLFLLCSLDGVDGDLSLALTKWNSIDFGSHDCGKFLELSHWIRTGWKHNDDGHLIGRILIRLLHVEWWWDDESRAHFFFLFNQLLDHWDDLVWSKDSQEHCLSYQGHGSEGFWPVGFLALGFLQIVDSFPFIKVFLEVCVKSFEAFKFFRNLQNRSPHLVGHPSIFTSWVWSRHLNSSTTSHQESDFCRLQDTVNFIHDLQAHHEGEQELVFFV